MGTGGRSGMLQMKKYEELEFTDDFMFGKVLYHNIDLCRKLLEMLLQRKIRELRYLGTQKTIDITRDAKSARFDVYTEDDGNSVYDIEMQVAKRGDLAKRSSYGLCECIRG